MSSATNPQSQETIKPPHIVDPARNGLPSVPSQSRKSEVQVHAWYDARSFSSMWSSADVLARIPQTAYTGIVLRSDTAEELGRYLPAQFLRIINVENGGELVQLLSGGALPKPENPLFEQWIVASHLHDILSSARQRGLRTCLWADIGDSESLHKAIHEGAHHEYLVLRFADVTNIPLELAIATLQSSRTILIKQIADPDDCEGATVSLEIMEVGADGVMFSPREHAVLDRFLAALRRSNTPVICLAPATVVSVRGIGMGHRACVDLATIFSDSEGLLIGSTSHGGILCCPEVFPLPYMDLRPFRVNAGGVHAYIYGPENRTNYLSELRAGCKGMIVGLDGRTRYAPVGRIKTEVRPLRLIEAELPSGRRINALLQDDWHVRIYSDQGKPLNVTELRVGQRILGHEATIGRHVGIPIEETIIER
jgi:3-amino-4-hydroxybenzoic acid synthase